MSRPVVVWMRNIDPFSNQVKAFDKNDFDRQVFNGMVQGNSRQDILVIENDSGYANVETRTDTNPEVGHSFLHEGDEFDI